MSNPKETPTAPAAGSEQAARRIFDVIDDDIRGRHTLKHVWSAIDRDVMDNELRPEWEHLIRKEIGILHQELSKEVLGSLELAECQLYAEKLSGNIVKEEYWKGELAALHRMRRVLSPNPR